MPSEWPNARSSFAATAYSRQQPNSWKTYPIRGSFGLPCRCAWKTSSSGMKESGVPGATMLRTPAISGITDARPTTTLM